MAAIISTPAFLGMAQVAEFLEFGEVLGVGGEGLLGLEEVDGFDLIRGLSNPDTDIGPFAIDLTGSSLLVAEDNRPDNYVDGLRTWAVFAFVVLVIAFLTIFILVSYNKDPRGVSHKIFSAMGVDPQIEKNLYGSIFSRWCSKFPQ